MKAKSILFTICCLFGNYVQSQTLPNTGFEILDTNGFPSQWSTGSYGAGSSMINHSGSFSVSVWNWYYYGKGFAVNGTANSHLSAYEGGTPYTQKATQLNGFYRYDTMGTYTNNDSALVAVLLKKYNPSSQQSDTIGYGTVHLPAFAPSNGSFTSFSVDIVDWNPAIQPDSIVVLLQSSIQNGFCDNAGDGNCLYFNVDDLSLETPLGITDLSGNYMKTEVYPNPIIQNATIKIKSELDCKARITISDASGKMLMVENTFLIAGENDYVVSMSELYKGVYFVTIENIFGRKTIKVIKQ
jgi:hypothetical protein